MSEPFEPFKDFDPLLGKVPLKPFSNLSDIVSRARWLLKSRTVEQISAIARDIDWQIDGHFDDLRNEEIERLQKTGLIINGKGDKFLSENNYHDPYDPEDGIYCLWENLDLDIPLREDSSEIEALKASKNYWKEIAIEECPDGKPYELFAVLALWMLADAVYFIEKELLELAGEHALKAMEALCYAEQLRDVEYINNAHALEIAQLHENSNEEVENLIHLQEKSQQLSVDFLKKQEELSKKHDELSKEIERLQQLVNYQEEEQRRKKQELGIQLNKHRHRESHEAKSMVIAEWNKNKSQFSSAEKAGNYFADWLLDTQKFRREYAPRTVTKWILEYAKEQGIRFR